MWFSTIVLKDQYIFFRVFTVGPSRFFSIHQIWSRKRSLDVPFWFYCLSQWCQYYRVLLCLISTCSGTNFSAPFTAVASLSHQWHIVFIPFFFFSILQAEQHRGNFLLSSITIKILKLDNNSWHFFLVLWSFFKEKSAYGMSPWLSCLLQT